MQRLGILIAALGLLLGAQDARASSVTLSPNIVSGGTFIGGYGLLVRKFSLTFDYSSVDDLEQIESVELIIATDNALNSGGTANISVFSQLLGGGTPLVGSDTVPRGDHASVEITHIPTLTEALITDTMTLDVTTDLVFKIGNGFETDMGISALTTYLIAATELVVIYKEEAPPAVPLPGTAILAGAGLLGLRLLTRRRRPS